MCVCVTQKKLHSTMCAILCMQLLMVGAITEKVKYSLYLIGHLSAKISCILHLI
jgi:hypothetical protein